MVILQDWRRRPGSPCAPWTDQLYSDTVGVTDRFQRVLNAAARVVTNTRKYDRGLHYTMTHDLHWLDMTDFVQFRIASCNYSLSLPSWHGSRISIGTVFSSKTETIKISTPVITE